MTEILFLRCREYRAVEIDPLNAAFLRERFPGITLFEEDFLDFDPARLPETTEEKIYVIGNIPYNITTPILKKILDNRESITRALLMMQREAANRILSPKGTKDYGALNILLSCYTQTRKLFNVSPNAFYPPPNVTSSLVEIIFKESAPGDFDYRLFRDLLGAAFRYRRKTLKNSLSNSIFEKYIKGDKRFDKRAEELDVIDFVKIAESIRESNE